MRIIISGLTAIVAIELFYLRVISQVAVARLSIDPATITIPEIDFKPRTANDFFRRGNGRKKVRDYRGAISDYNRSIELNPIFFSAYLQRGILRQEMRDYRGSIYDYSMAIGLNPNLPQAHYYRGISYRKLDQPKLSMLDFQRAAKLFEIKGEIANARSALNAMQQLKFEVNKKTF